jgi:hypothetical protein
MAGICHGHVWFKVCQVLGFLFNLSHCFSEIKNEILLVMFYYIHNIFDKFVPILGPEGITEMTTYLTCLNSPNIYTFINLELSSIKHTHPKSPSI